MPWLAYIAELGTHCAIDGEGGEGIAQRQQVQDVAQVVVDVGAELLREHAAHHGHDALGQFRDQEHADNGQQHPRCSVRPLLGAAANVVAVAAAFAASTVTAILDGWIREWTNKL
jgi:hypothetical protein